MKNTMRSLVAGVMLASAVSLPAVADVPVTVNGGISQWYFDNDRNLDDESTPWVSLEWAFTDQWATEIFYTEDETNIRRRGGKADISNWQLNVLYYGGSYIGGDRRVRPYLVFGGGEVDYEYDGGFDTVETTVNAGGGLRLMLTPRFGARLDARMLHSLDENHNDILLSAGLNFYFGKVTEDIPPPPAPVDSDGDGVTDDLDQCPGTPAGTRVDASGCPLPVERVASIKLKVNFDFDSSDVKEQYFDDIGELAAFLKRFDDIDVELEGHTDSTGPESYNQKLSERRASAVKDLLVNQYGIAASRIKPMGYGESQPVATNDTREGRAENRRTMATLEVTYEE